VNAEIKKKMSLWESAAMMLKFFFLKTFAMVLLGCPPSDISSN
jgi:hypothetical protein